ncbi:MAG: Ig-like domain repeat protein, partial [Terracidiphilus sp.]
QTDILTITNWLTGHGFTVAQVTKDRMSIRFNGTAAQVQSAFHTEIHNLVVKGVAHIGNMSDPHIPAALAPVVVGVKALHNFFPRPMHHMGQVVQRDASTGKWVRQAPVGAVSSAATGSAKPLLSAGPYRLPATKPAATSPQYGISVGGTSPYLVEDVDPWDFATIYNILPLWNASTSIDGTGQTIAIAGTSDIDVGQTGETGANGNNDVFTFRNYFGLPTGNAANTPKRISGNTQPLTVCTDTTGNVPYPTNPCGIDDLEENSLDVEWSGSVAKNAQIVLVASYPASTTDDNLYDSESYIVDNLTARIMNVSYGECELSNGTAANVQYYNLWEQAAAEGISVFVAAGDSGSAACDDGYTWAASGLTVSGLASTPWNTAVGGTDFNWCNIDTADGSGGTECTASPYWSSTPITSQGSTAAVTSALGYVPETPWNESCANPLTLKWVQDAANYFYDIPSTGSNGVTNTEQSCNFLLDYDFDYYEGYYGLGYYYPYITYLLSTVGGSGGASNCVVGTPVINESTGEISGCATSSGVGATGTTNNPDTGAPQASLATYNNGWPKPTWQQASTNNITGLPNDGVRDIPDVSFFASDGFISSSAYLICVSAANSGNTPCTYSTYTEPFYQEVGGTSVATPAMAGVMALINQKTGVTQGFANPELYTLAAKQSTNGYSACSAESVTASSATCMFNDIDAGPTPSIPYTNAVPCDAADKTPNCTASYSTLGYSDSEYGLGILTGYSGTTGYDLATGLGSLNVANVVNNWVSAVGSGATTITVTPTPNPVSLGASLSVLVTVGSSPSGKTTPSGSVTLSGGGYTSAAETLVSGGTDSTSSYTFTIPAGTLTGGAVTLTANYTGDTNYAPNSQTAGVTVNKLTPSVSAAPTPPSIQSNQQVVITGTVTGSGATPTGTVTVSYGSTYTSSAATLNGSGQYSVTITPNSLPGGTPNQIDSLNVQYSGDANYNSASTTTSVTVTFFQVLTPTMTITPTASTLNSGSALLVTVSLACNVPPNPTGSCTGAAIPSGTVTLYGGGYDTQASPASANLSNGTATFNIPANTLNTNSNPALPLSDTLTATYNGDSNYAQVSKMATLSVFESVYALAGTNLSSVTPGTAASTTVAVSSTSNYTGTVALASSSCVLTEYPSGVTSSTPGNPTCTLSGNGTVTFANGVPTGSPVTFAIHTTSLTTVSELRRPAIGPRSPSVQLAKLSTSASPRTPQPSGAESFGAPGSGTGWLGAGSGAVLALVLFFGIPARRRSWRAMLSVLVAMVAIGALASCNSGGGGSSPSQPTLPTPTVTVTPASNTVAFNAPLNVVVTVTGTAGTATGGVTLSGGALAGLNGTLSSGSYTFTIPANTFAGGTSVTLLASYQGSTAYNPATGQSTPVTVNYVATTAGTYTFTVTPASNPSVSPSVATTFTVTVN